MAVVAGRGLIGKVASVGHAYARVVLLTDPGSRAGARLRQSCSTGVAEGNGAALLALKYLPRDTPIAAGEDVITSGLGGVFPAGYLIGTVRDVISGEGGFYQTAMVTPAVDVARLEYVIVLKRAPPLIDDGSEGGE
jgi:rod shape-determining protein MreC